MTHYSELPFDEEAERRLLMDLMPSLGEFEYVPTSGSTEEYNCVGWAVGDDTKNWTPSPVGGYYWPPDLPSFPLVSILEELFRREGYERCSSPDQEEGVEKVAIYGDSQGEGKHVARQLPSGEWTSKMGGAADITHADHAAVEAPLFGTLRVIMSRRAPVTEPPEAVPQLTIVSHQPRR